MIEDNFGRLDVLVNNAAIALETTQKPSEVETQTLRETFDVNFFGTIAVTQTLLPLIRKSEAGRIVNVSSGLGSLTQLCAEGWPCLLQVLRKEHQVIQHEVIVVHHSMLMRVQASQNRSPRRRTERRRD